MIMDVTSVVNVGVEVVVVLTDETAVDDVVVAKNLNFDFIVKVFMALEHHLGLVPSSPGFEDYIADHRLVFGSYNL
ncbi:hypothetical protein NDU88_005764 [Pleurodeles waltl]|uniref:Uncharacterized protein n=1 Tax=Pleurodeles waltl TaxID=8319 RepID=A0AAV7SMT3_PLEWA|nr:hypothetical protein NDU88_005764 [Pleurodeles waltl]